MRSSILPSLVYFVHTLRCWNCILKSRYKVHNIWKTLLMPKKQSFLFQVELRAINSSQYLKNILMPKKTKVSFSGWTMCRMCKTLPGFRKKVRKTFPHHLKRVILSFSIWVIMALFMKFLLSFLFLFLSLNLNLFILPSKMSITPICAFYSFEHFI